MIVSLQWPILPSQTNPPPSSFTPSPTNQFVLALLPSGLNSVTVHRINNNQREEVIVSIKCVMCVNLSARCVHKSRLVKMIAIKTHVHDLWVQAVSVTDSRKIVTVANAAQYLINQIVATNLLAREWTFCNAFLQVYILYIISTLPQWGTAGAEIKSGSPWKSKVPFFFLPFLSKTLQNKGRKTMREREREWERSG